MPAVFAHCLKTPIKLFIALLVIYGISLLYLYNSTAIEISPIKEPITVRTKREYKYVLQWSERIVAPFTFMGYGNSGFIKNKCKYTNCFVTANASILDVTEFDAVLFNGRTIISMDPSELPKRRSSKQKYVFTATESSDRFPACEEALDNFFNWTWTYKLRSDLRFGYITIYDITGNVIGPSIDMKWPEKMKPVGKDVKAKLSKKSKAAAWFVSNCNTKSKREDLVAEVNKELAAYGWNVDIYGTCGQLTCPRKNWRECDKKVKKDYFFYFAFENSFDEDYVTEKLLTALNNFAVPVVFGSADYSRFLPPGSYLDARKLGAKNLARVMNELITNKNKYYDYFRWRNHFSYNQTLTNTDVCKLCEALNDDTKMNTASVWKDFRRWWNGENLTDKCS